MVGSRAIVVHVRQDGWAYGQGHAVLDFPLASLGLRLLPPWRGKVGMGGEARPGHATGLHPHPHRHMRQDKVKRMSCRVLAPSPSGRGDRRCALCDKHLELNLAPMTLTLPRLRGRGTCVNLTWSDLADQHRRLA